MNRLQFLFIQCVNEKTDSAFVSAPLVAGIGGGGKSLQSHYCCRFNLAQGCQSIFKLIATYAGQLVSLTWTAENKHVIIVITKR